MKAVFSGKKTMTALQDTNLSTAATKKALSIIISALGQNLFRTV